MLNLFQTDFAAALIILAVLVVSFTLHELAHATVAVWEGDNTPELEGRLTLNPLRHIDPMGFILIIVPVLFIFQDRKINPNETIRT